MSVYEITETQLAALSAITVEQAATFRFDMIAAGFGTVDIANVPEHRWNHILAKAVAS